MAEEPTKKPYRDYRDIPLLGFRVVIEEVRSHSVSLRVHEIVGFDARDPNVLLFMDASNEFPSESDHEKAGVYLSAFIKWDGCCDIHFKEHGHHFCGIKDAGAVGLLLRRLYELAAELMPEHRDMVLEEP